MSWYPLPCPCPALQGETPGAGALHDRKGVLISVKANSFGGALRILAVTLGPAQRSAVECLSFCAEWGMRFISLRFRALKLYALKLRIKLESKLQRPQHAGALTPGCGHLPVLLAAAQHYAYFSRPQALKLLSPLCASQPMAQLRARISGPKDLKL